MSDNTNNGFPVPEEPLTREEQYLSAIAGVTSSSDIPEKPRTRIEAYLNRIVENGGGGGGSFEPTDEQLAAMNSGITAEDVEQIETNKTNISTINSNLIYSPTQPTGDIPDGAIWINTTSNVLSDYIKKYHVCNNLFDTFDIAGEIPSVTTGALISSELGGCTSLIPISNANVVLSGIRETSTQIYLFLYDENQDYIYMAASGSSTGSFEVNSNTITGYENARYIRVRTDHLAYNTHDIMLNYGSTPLPYEPYTTIIWHSNNQ